MSSISPIMSEEMRQDGVIVLESFANPSHTWFAKNDPVMGGESYATVLIKNGLGIFDGEVVNVPFLQAPGFVTMESKGGVYPDVSSCQSLRLVLQTTTEMYTGYRASFGTRHVPGNRFAFGYKANFQVPATDDPEQMAVVDIPFHDFTVRWDDATGDPIVTCEENKDFCPDSKTLKNMERITIWGEGVAGKIHLEIESIEAIGCNPANTVRAGVTNTDRDDPAFLSVMSILLLGAAFAFVITKVLFRQKSSGYEDIRNGNVTTDSNVQIV